MRVKFTEMNNEGKDFEMVVRDNREDCTPGEQKLYDLLAEMGGKCVQMGKTCIERLPDIGAHMTAATLSHLGGSDSYRTCIHRAARYLVSRNKATWEYCTQWASGSTLWKGPQGHSEVITLEALEFYGF